jgi:predicted alpha/beta-fold hydrolase
MNHLKLGKIKKFFKFTCFTFLTYCSYEYYNKSDKMKIIYNHDKLKSIIELNPSFSKKIYYPSFFFPSGHFQSIMLVYMNYMEKTFNLFLNHYYSKTLKYIKARDGEKIFMEFYQKTLNLDNNSENMENFEFLKNFNDSNILVIIPGACGSGGEFYLVDILERFVSQNFKCISVNHRGILKYPLENCRLYHSGFTDDLKDVFEFLRNNVKNSKYFLLGFSMGGNIVTKFIGENGDDTKNLYNIYGGCSVCGPLDLAKLNEFIEDKSYTKLYSKFFCNNLKKVFNKNKDKLMQSSIFINDDARQEFLIELDKTKLASKFYENYILKSFDFNNKEEYNKISSASTYISNVKVPTLCIFSEDDPIIPLYSLEGSNYEKNENVIVAVTKSGGHVGFFKGFVLRRWIHEPIIEFINDVSHLKI